MKNLFLITVLFFLLPIKSYGYEIEWGTNDHEKQEIKCSTPIETIKKEIYERIEDFSKVYKNEFLEKNLNKIYVCKNLSLSNLDWINGTYLDSEKSIFVEVGDGNHNDTQFILHHEFSSLVFLKYFNKELSNKWIQNNNFEYNYEYRSDGWIANPKLQKNGALFLYSTSDLENDFNVMAAYYLSGYLKNDLDDAARQFRRIKNKKQIIALIYKDFIK